MWDFSTDPEFQARLDWMDTFVREEVEPLDHLTHQDEHTVYAPLSPELASDVVGKLSTDLAITGD